MRPKNIIPPRITKPANIPATILYPFSENCLHFITIDIMKPRKNNIEAVTIPISAIKSLPNEKEMNEKINKCST